METLSVFTMTSDQVWSYHAMMTRCGKLLHSLDVSLNFKISLNLVELMLSTTMMLYRFSERVALSNGFKVMQRTRV